MSTTDDAAAVQLLRRYYGPAFGELGYYTGSVFDTWDSTGTRAADVDRFTADDLVAVTFLSVEVDPRAAFALLGGRADRFSDLLAALGPDRDLADEADPLPDSWAGWTLMNELETLPGVGPTIASKLLARKRPRLRPIYDSVVAAVTDTRAQLWEPLRVALRADNLELHRRLRRLHAASGLPADVSALRVLDVIAWLEGKDQTPTRTPASP